LKNFCNLYLYFIIKSIKSVCLLFFVSKLHISKKTNKYFDQFNLFLREFEKKDSKKYLSLNIFLLSENGIIQKLIKKFNFCDSIRACDYFIGDRCRIAITMQHNPDHRQFSMAGT